MTTIKLQNDTIIKAEGIRTNGNCKAVFCITTGEVYSSALDASEANNLHPSAVSRLIANNGKCRNGKRFCYVSQIVEHLDEIAECNRVRQQKVMSYDAEVAKKEKALKANEEYEKRKTKCEMLKKKLEEEERLKTEAWETLVNLRKEGLS